MRMKMGLAMNVTMKMRVKRGVMEVRLKKGAMEMRVKKKRCT